MIRGSLFTMLGTVATSVFGYVYWMLAARLVPVADVGATSGIMSLVTGLALFTNVGVCGFVTERLPALEGRRAWVRLVGQAIWPTSAVTFLVTALVEGVLVLRALDPARRGLGAVVVASAAGLALTFLSILTVVLISARRAELAAVLDVVMGATKLLSLFGLIVRDDETALVRSWTVSLLVTCAIGALALLPRLGHGRLRRPVVSPSILSGLELRPVIGHQLTSVGGLMVPFLLPTIVIYRLDATRNAYFYATWMMGSAFFMISPSVETALFVEGVRDARRLAASLRRAIRLLAVLLPVPILVAVFGGQYLLLLFGPAYATKGAVLLAILAVAAVPDAITNLGSGVLRATGRLRWSASLNMAMGIVALGGAWVLLPVLGINGAGVAWITAQSLGSIPVIPLLGRLLLTRPHVDETDVTDRHSSPLARHATNRSAGTWIDRRRAHHSRRERPS
jgi:O-antigen/teichoic acid export membrane protein